MSSLYGACAEPTALWLRDGQATSHVGTMCRGIRNTPACMLGHREELERM